MSFSISTIGLDMGSENVTLSDPRCHVHRSEHKLLGRTPLNACGTSVRFTNDTIIFSNFLIIPPKDNDNENDDDDDSDNTTSVSNIERVIPIECHYNRVSELRLSYLPLMRHILFTETGVGRFQFQIEQFRDASFARKVSPSAYPLKVTSSDDIYLQVSLGESALEGEERYGMEVQTCVASPSSSMMAMHNDSSEELIRNSCPAKEDVEVIDSEQHSSDGSGKQNASGPHHHFRFSFKPNVLSGSSSDSSSSGKASSSSMGLVYIHCRVRLCSAPSCPRPSSECAPLRPSRSEGGGNRVKRAVTEPLGGNEWESTGHHLSTGPLFVTVFDTTDAPRSTEAPLYSPLVIVLGSLAGLATIVAIGVIVAWMLTHKGQGRDEVTTG